MGHEASGSVFRAVVCDSGHVNQTFPRLHRQLPFDRRPHCASFCLLVTVRSSRPVLLNGLRHLPWSLQHAPAEWCSASAATWSAYHLAMAAVPRPTCGRPNSTLLRRCRPVPKSIIMTPVLLDSVHYALELHGGTLVSAEEDEVQQLRRSPVLQTSPHHDPYCLPLRLLSARLIAHSYNEPPQRPALPAVMTCS